jgi:hypothetical protein
MFRVNAVPVTADMPKLKSCGDFAMFFFIKDTIKISLTII